MKRNKKAFTIVELVIVIAVIAILAAVLIPTFSNIIKKAQTSKDTQLVRNLNTSLALDVNVKHNTMQDALDAVEKQGYNLDKINASAMQAEILWDSHNDVFVYLDSEGKINYLPEIQKDREATDIELWQICKEKPTTPKYSIYAGNGWNITNVENLTVGFDAGKCNNIESISYKNNATVQTVVIRTNSANTTLSIFAPNDEVKHYDFCGKVIVKAAKDASYHEFGDVAFMEINKGHVVVETGASVDLMYSNPQAYKVQNNEIVLDTVATVPAVTVSNNGEVDHAHASSGTSATATTSASQNVTFDYDGVNLSKEDSNHTTVNHEYGTYANDDVNSWSIETAAEQAVVEMKTKEAAKNAPAPEDPEIEYVAVNVSKVATLGVGAYYTSLKTAYDAAGDGETIALMTDITLWDEAGGFTAMWDITKNITVDLNKHTLYLKWINNDKYMITASGNVSIINGNVDCKTTSTGRTAIKVGTNANVVIDDLNVSCYLESDPTQLGCCIGSTANNNKCTINGGNFNGSIQTNGTYTNNTFIINGGTFLDTYFPATGNYEINGGTFNATNGSAFYFKSGSPIRINAGEFNVKLDSDYDGGKWAHHDNGVFGGNAALIVESCNYGGHGVSTINLSINEDIKFNVIRDGYSGIFYDVLIINYDYNGETPNKVNCEGVEINYAIVDKGVVDENGQIKGHITDNNGSDPTDGWLIFDDTNVTIIHPED